VKKVIVTILVMLAAIMLGVSVAFIGAAVASASTGKVCGMAERMVQESSGGVWNLSRPNPFNTTQEFCISPNASGPGFTVNNNVSYDGMVRAFPFTGVGCAYNLCSRNTDLPKQIDKLPKASNMSWSWRGERTNDYNNAAIDLWFSKTDQIIQQDNGAELMVWLYSPPGYGSTPGVDFHYVKIGHRHYWFTAWRAHHGKYSWWYIQFRTTKTVFGVKQLWMKPFMRYAESRGLLKSDWCMTSVHAGYELWKGGKGLHTVWFNVHA